MSYQIVEVPQFTNHWDELYDAITDNKNRAVLVPVPSDKSASGYRQNVVVAMKNRKLAINTICQTHEMLCVWFRGFIEENLSEEKPL